MFLYGAYEKRYIGAKVMRPENIRQTEFWQIYMGTLINLPEIREQN